MTMNVAMNIAVGSINIMKIIHFISTTVVFRVLARELFHIKLSFLSLISHFNYVPVFARLYIIYNYVPILTRTHHWISNAFYSLYIV